MNLLGSVENCCLWLDKNYETIEALTPLHNKRVVVTIKEFKNTRRSRANRYYWGVVVPAVYNAFAENGIKLINHEQAHEAMRNRFLLEEVDGLDYRVPKSTTKMSISEFSDYIFVIIDYLREYFKWEVPAPSGEA